MDFSVVELRKLYFDVQVDGFFISKGRTIDFLNENLLHQYCSVLYDYVRHHRDFPVVARSYCIFTSKFYIFIKQ